MGGESGPASTAVATALPTARLTPAEIHVFDLLARGRSNREIADELVLTEATVRSHLTRIYSKLEVRGRPELLVRLAQPGSTATAATRAQGTGTSPRPVAVRGFVLGGVAAVVALLAVAAPITLVATGPAFLLAAVLVLRGGAGGGTIPSWLRWVLIGAAALLCLGALGVVVMLVALLASG